MIEKREYHGFGHSFYLTENGTLMVTPGRIEVELPFKANHIRRGSTGDDSVFFGARGEHGDWTLLWNPGDDPSTWMIGQNHAGAIKEKPLFLAGVNLGLTIEVEVTGQSSLRRRPRSSRTGR